MKAVCFFFIKCCDAHFCCICGILSVVSRRTRAIQKRRPEPDGIALRDSDASLRDGVALRLVLPQRMDQLQHTAPCLDNFAPTSSQSLSQSDHSSLFLYWFPLRIKLKEVPVVGIPPKTFHDGFQHLANLILPLMMFIANIVKFLLL